MHGIQLRGQLPVHESMLPEELAPAASLGGQLELITIRVVVPARTSTV